MLSAVWSNKMPLLLVADRLLIELKSYFVQMLPVFHYVKCEHPKLTLEESVLSDIKINTYHFSCFYFVLLFFFSFAGT